MKKKKKKELSSEKFIIPPYSRLFVFSDFQISSSLQQFIQCFFLRFIHERISADIE